jgi:hypothetical protein
VTWLLSFLAVAAAAAAAAAAAVCCCRSFDIGAQLWRARKSDGTVVSTLQDGFKYIVGVKWLPTGWEIG